MVVDDQVPGEITGCLDDGSAFVAGNQDTARAAHLASQPGSTADEWLAFERFELLAASETARTARRQDGGKHDATFSL